GLLPFLVRHWKTSRVCVPLRTVCVLIPVFVCVLDVSCVCSRDSKLSMLLRESLGNMNCRTTMIAHISSSPSNFSDTLSTIQIASRLLRMKKKKTKVSMQYTSSSSGGESSCEEGRMRRPTHLRPFHSRSSADSDLPLLHLSSDPDNYSSSEQSCDTVIYVGPNGGAISDRELTDNEGPPEFVPVIPVLPTTPPLRQQQTPLGHPLPPVPEEGAECLKCNTFAELQERLECIDGSEEEAELAQTMIESLSLTGSCSVTGSSGAGHTNTNPLQRAKSASLHDSRESLSAGSSSDGKPRPLGSPRLGIASLTKTSDYRPPSSPSQRCKVYTQKGVMPGTPPLSCQSLSTADSLAADSVRSSTESLLQPMSLSRTSPAGMSPRDLKRTNSSSASLGSAETLCDENVPQIPLDGRRDSKSYSSFCYSPNPSSLGEDELVFTLGCKEGLEVRGLLEGGGRPTSIISFSSDCSLTALDSGVIPITTASVAGAMAAVPSRRSSISSWLSDLSVVSDGDQSLHSFSQSHGHGEALAEPDPTQVSLGYGGRKTPESEVALSGDVKGRETKERRKRLPPSLGKTTISLPDMQTLGASRPPFKTNITVHPCVAVKPMVKPEKWVVDPPAWPQGDRASRVDSGYGGDRHSSSSGEAISSPDSCKRVVDGSEMVLVSSGECLVTPVYSADILRTASLPRGWHRLNRHDGLDEDPLRYDANGGGGEYRGLGVTSSTPCSPRATLDRRGYSGKHGLFSRQKGIPPLPPVRKSKEQGRRPPQPHARSQPWPLLLEDSRLFSAKLEQLANRTNSLGRSLGWKVSAGGGRGDCTMPRTGRSLTRGGSFPGSAPQSPKSSQSKISAARSLSASSTKKLSFSTKSLPQSVNRSSSLPPNGKPQAQGQTSIQGLAAKLPLRAVNGRISELLQGSGGSRSAGHNRGGGSEAGEERGAGGGGGGVGAQGEERPLVVHTLPSPYSKITAPRQPHRCSSGHASDNSSVLSGELPPAMGKTALFYHSGGSSGYESMLRDSEATGSTSSAQDSLSEHSSATSSSRRSLKNNKKKNNSTGQLL
ncbi:unnamed protein product, partial [Oncorhynchus mykiss]